MERQEGANDELSIRADPLAEEDREQSIIIPPLRLFSLRGGGDLTDNPTIPATDTYTHTYTHTHIQEAVYTLDWIERTFPFYLEHGTAVGLLFLVTDTG